MTATPKETQYVSNIDYFGKPVYFYSLKQGIEDGFLAPYKVVRIYIDKDIEGWRPPKGLLDKYAREVEDRIYNLKDYDRTLIIDERTQLVAKRVRDYLKETDRFAKSIVFCEDIDHATRMRQALINENADLVSENGKYIMPITGDDQIGKNELDNFINPEETYPVIVTTSKLMSTGVDAQTCKLIVLDKNINSMTEFKQIIGRGTRVREDFGKMFFAIMDFRNATRLFYDPDFDGLPVQVYEPKPGESPVPPDEEEGVPHVDITRYELIGEKGEGFEVAHDESSEYRPKYHVSGVDVQIIGERVKYLDKDGNLITVSLKDYTRQNIHKLYDSLDSFLHKWNKAERKSAIIAELVEQGVFIEELRERVGMELDLFDLICHVAFDMPPLTRRERANNVKKKSYFAKYRDLARKVLEAILDKYADEGIKAIEEGLDDRRLVDFLRVPPLDQIGMPVQIIREFGGKQSYLRAVKELEEQIYQAA